MILVIIIVTLHFKRMPKKAFKGDLTDLFAVQFL